MDIKICSNIVKYRKESGVTQAELAEYLGVSPQAVSRWEQEISTPDVYLLPKIALFFHVSIDSLFGTSNTDAADLLVSKYSIIQNDKNYREAKDGIDSLLEANEENLKVQALLCKLEYLRGIEYLNKSKAACEKLKSLAAGSDGTWLKRANVQLMRVDEMLGDTSFIKANQKAFKQQQTAENFINLLLAVSHGKEQQYKEVLRVGKQYIATFTREEQRAIYPILMDVAYSLGETDYVEECFQVIVEDTKNIPQIFNAWWLLWKSYVKADNKKEAERCREELLKQLPNQNYNEYIYEEIKLHLEGQGDQPATIL